jgi:hypothetical protein
MARVRSLPRLHRHQRRLYDLNSGRSLRTQLDLEPIILQEQASDGRTVIEKFERHADVAGLTRGCARRMCSLTRSHARAIVSPYVRPDSLEALQ